MRAALETVRLTRDLPKEGLHRGAVGTVVEVLRTPEEAYEVEFTDGRGVMRALVTLRPADIEPTERQATAGMIQPGSKANSVAPPVAPDEFYREVTKRKDVREILRRLAR